MPSLLGTALEIPRLLVGQALRPIRMAMRGPMPHPKTQRELAGLVDNSLKHEIRAGHTHRFITLMLVTVGERVFCRRYTYAVLALGFPDGSARSGQARQDRCEHRGTGAPGPGGVVPAVDQAYADALKELGASYMLAGATEPRA